MHVPLVGISGKARAGKDTVADYLLELGWKRKLSFAGNLKKICSDVFDIDIEIFNDQELKKKPFDVPMGVTVDQAHKAVVAAFGHDIVFLWDNMIRLDTPRSLLQFIGTDLLRKLDNECHVNILKRVAGKNLSGIIVPDVRFPNEAEFILDNGGILLRIDRPAPYVLASDHPSETALDSWDKWSYKISNDLYGLNFLYDKVDNMLKHLGLREVKHGISYC